MAVGLLVLGGNSLLSRSLTFLNEIRVPTLPVWRFYNGSDD